MVRRKYNVGKRDQSDSGEGDSASMNKALAIIFWIAAVAAPLVICAFGVSQIPDVEQVATHWNAAGEVDKWGTPAELAGVWWVIGAAMAGTNLLLALCSLFNDKLYAMGLVHGISRENAPKLYAVLAVILVVMTAVISAAILR